MAGERMDIDFVVFNRKKREQYQIETAIGLKNGVRIVRKRALHGKAKSHIAQIYYNYSMLQEHYSSIPNVKLASTWMENEVLYTEYLEYPSLYELAITSAEHKDMNGVYKIIDDYITFMNSLHVTTVHHTGTSDQYREIFGQDLKYISGKVFQFSNIDLILENVFYNDLNYYVIDLEWVLPFHVPINYVMFRALHQLYDNLLDYVPIKYSEIMLYAGIDEQEQELYLNMEKSFNKWVMAKDYWPNYRKKVLHKSFSELQHSHQNDLQTIVHSHYIQQTYMRQSILLYAQDKPIGIWGTGSAALKTASILQKLGFQISCFIDNNSEKWGTTFEQLTVISPKESLSTYIVIGSSYYMDIKRQLDTFGLSEQEDYCFGIVN